MRTKILLAGLGLVALAALLIPTGEAGATLPTGVRDRTVVVTPDDPSQTYHWGPYNATTGAMFDAGYVVNSLGTNAYPVSIEGGDALMAAECEARMLRNGVNNALSNIFSLEDDSAGRRVSGVILSAVALDAGVPVTQGANPQSQFYWRPLAGGDAGMPWQINPQLNNGFIYVKAASSSIASTTIQTTFFPIGIGNGSTAATGAVGNWAPGYYCYIPFSSPSYGVSHVWVRLNRIFEPR